MGPMQTVTVQHERAKHPRTERISRAVKRAVDAMVFEGSHRRDAATRAGIAECTLQAALRKPSVLAYLNTAQQVLRTSAVARTISKAEQLMDSAVSEHVQLQAVQYLNPPVQRTENVHVHQQVTPGLVIVFNGVSQPGDDAQQITNQPHETAKTKIINALPKPVPHPGMRNAQVIAPPETPPGGGRRGAKTRDA